MNQEGSLFHEVIFRFISSLCGFIYMSKLSKPVRNRKHYFYSTYVVCIFLALCSCFLKSVPSRSYRRWSIDTTMYLQLSRNSYFVIFVVIGLFTVTTQFDVQGETESKENIENDLNDISNVDESESLLSNVVSDVNKTLTNLYNTVTLANVTTENTTKSANETRKTIRCKEIVYDPNDDVEPTVEIVNASQLMKLLHVNPEITSRDTEADCLLVFFYARACPFSARAAPHFNALARAYPTVKMVALDALKYSGTNTVYGIVGVPTLKVFHNGRPYGKFNGTEYNIQSFSKFLHAVTGKSAQSLLVTSKDFQGPVSSVVETETDYFLVLSWLFIIVCSIYYFMQSKCWTMIVEMVKNNWRESEAQHEHID